MRSINGKDSTLLPNRVRAIRSYSANVAPPEAGGSCLELTYPFYLGTLILVRKYRGLRQGASCSLRPLNPIY